jgi:hypothetical protein
VFSSSQEQRNSSLVKTLSFSFARAAGSTGVIISIGPHVIPILFDALKCPELECVQLVQLLSNIVTLGISHRNNPDEFGETIREQLLALLPIITEKLQVTTDTELKCAWLSLSTAISSMEPNLESSNNQALLELYQNGSVQIKASLLHTVDLQRWTFPEKVRLVKHLCEDILTIDLARDISGWIDDALNILLRFLKEYGEEKDQLLSLLPDLVGFLETIALNYHISYQSTIVAIV